ncbi:MAG: GIY-YIG nuclease family protein [Dehalococcoidia bacterium]|nr:GIY-YIG nuclease family protein [Dehalococcoidia bacterium]
MNRSGITDREWFFYIVRCRDNSLYSGIAVDIQERLKEHNNGTGAKYTSGRRPVALVYSEPCNNVSEARKREVQVKRWSKTEKERLIQGTYPIQM